MFASVHICVCVYIRTCVCGYVCVGKCIYGHVFLCICVCVCVCVCICMHGRMFVGMCVCERVSVLCFARMWMSDKCICSYEHETHFLCL